MKSTKKSLFLSTISLVLCFAMLLGTTWAWFTDEVTSGVNQIKAGNLDVELYAGDTKVTESTKLFDDVTLWEPGAYAYETFTIKNVGNLAFKYSMQINAYNATVVDGHSLDEVLKVKVVETAPTSRPSYTDGVALKGWSLGYDELPLYPVGNVPENGASAKTFTVVIYWEPTDNDNQWNMNNGNQGKVLSVDLGVNLVATQLTYEKDSFDDQYDLSAKLPVLATFPSISQEDITNGEKSVEIEKQGAIESASVPATGAATVFNELKKADTEEVSYNNDLVLTLNVAETGKKTETIESGEQATIDLDISMSAVMTVTNASTNEVVETNKKDDVKELDAYSVIQLQIGTGYTSVAVNHDGKPMHTTLAEDTDGAGYYSYNKADGILTLNTKTFSPFVITAVKGTPAPYAVIENVGPYTLGNTAATDEISSMIELLGNENTKIYGATLADGNGSCMKHGKDTTLKNIWKYSCDTTTYSKEEIKEYFGEYTTLAYVVSFDKDVEYNNGDGNMVLCYGSPGGQWLVQNPVKANFNLETELLAMAFRCYAEYCNEKNPGTYSEEFVNKAIVLMSDQTALVAPENQMYFTFISAATEKLNSTEDPVWNSFMIKKQAQWLCTYSANTEYTFSNKSLALDSVLNGATFKCSAAMLDFDGSNDQITMKVALYAYKSAADATAISADRILVNEVSYLLGE